MIGGNGMETDYLVVGAGASGMIFVDELLARSDASIVIADRWDKPGGHWNHAYPFVTLHQPSAFYGAGSVPLGYNRIATRGLNAGLYEQASGADISSYFGGLMQRFLDTGRVTYLPMSEYEGDFQDNNVVRTGLGRCRLDVDVKKRVVDTAFYGVQSPLTHTRNFPVHHGNVVPPNDLPRLVARHPSFVILGAGKTAIDAIVWLLESGVGSQNITWIAPRDSWLTNRETVQPGDTHRPRMLQSQVNKLSAYANATDLDDMFSRLEHDEEIFRIDRSVRPTMHYGATISRGELAHLRSVKKIVREGRVTIISGGYVWLERDGIKVPDEALIVDCTARGLNYRPPTPVFDGKRITLQMIRRSLVSLSAAATAFIESRPSADTEKNALCQPIPYADDLSSWLDCALADLLAQEKWNSDSELFAWLKTHRLMGAGFEPTRPSDPAIKVLGRQIAERRPHAIANLERLISQRTAMVGTRASRDQTSKQLPVL